MADLDEAAINNPSTDAGHIEVDLSDETQDFRMLNSLSFLADTNDLSLPKRGEKDFEPNPTLFQADILSASRQAMHNALSYPRLHNPKNKVTGVYAPNGPAPPPESKLCTITEDSLAVKPVPASIGVSANTCVYVANPKGGLFKTIGQADRWNRVWLLPEEALYLLERGSLDIRWPRGAVGDGEEDDIEDSGIPMSLQAAYASFIGHSGLTMEKFSVYTGLRRLGYAVFRAPGWCQDSDTKEASDATTQIEGPQLAKGQGPGLAGIFSQFLQWLQDSPSTTAAGPVIGFGIHRGYSHLFRKLALIPYYDPLTAPPSSAELPYVVALHIYKPSTHIRKSALPNPDFRIAVVDARIDTDMPTLSQIGSLLESTPLEPPASNKPLYVRLKNGYRNVILAVVDQGVVSYLRLADAAFGKEKIYEAQALRGNKHRGPHRNKSKKR